ncbi:MAG: Ig-like domain-containing protein [Terriglobia bacterium]|jgi:hypothetical protein
MSSLKTDDNLTGAAAGTSPAFALIHDTDEKMFTAYRIAAETSDSNSWTWTSPSTPSYATIAAFHAGFTSFTTYYATAAVQPKQVFENGTRYTSVALKTSLTPGSFWWDAANTRVYIRTTGDNAPSNYVSPGIEAGQRDYAVYATFKNFITLTGIETDKANLHGVYWNNSSGMLTTGVTALENFKNGIQYDGGTSNVVSYSTAAYNGANGFSLFESPSILVDHVVAHDNAQLTDDDDTAGIKFNDSTNIQPNMTVQYSHVYNNGIGQTTNRGKGIWADTVGPGFTAKYNLVHGNRTDGILAEADSAVIITNNIVYGTLGPDITGIALVANNSSIPMSNSLVANNVVYGIAGLGIKVAAVNFAGGCVNNLVKNNLSTGNTVQLAAYGGCENPGTNGSGNVYTYNGFGTQGTNFIAWGSGSGNYSTYATWEAAAGNCGTTGCSHSVQADPQFVNAAGFNFTLASSSPAIDAGLNLGSTYEWGLDPASTWPSSVITLNQNNYGAGWEMGAYVYTQTSAPWVVMTAPTASSTVSGTVTVSASSTAVSPAAISSVQFYLDSSPLGSPVISTSSPNTYSYSWNTASSTNGSHTLYALATDNYANTASSSAITVTVANAPVISNIATSTATSTATITWTTDEAADSQVQYGLTSAYGSSTVLNSTATTTHSVLITGLTGLTQYHFMVMSSNGTLSTSTDQTFTTASAGLPTATGVTITGTTTIGSTLTGSYTFSDPNGKVESGSIYQWLTAPSSGGSYSVISGATAKTYVLTSSDIGQYLKFQVTPASQSGTGSAAVSSTTAQIQSSGVPTASSVNITGTAIEGQTLTGHYTYAQADGVTQGVSTFRWLESDTAGGSYSAIPSATANTYALAPGDVGKYIEFEVTPVAIYPPTTGAAVQSSNVGPVVPSSLPVASAVGYTGTTTVGQTLTGSYTYTDSGGHPEATSTFRWLEASSSNGIYAAIGGATAKTYVLTSSDIGKYLEFEVTPVSTVATGAAVDSNPGSEIESSGAPTASSVNVSGTVTEGQTLTGSYAYAQADGVPEGASLYRWLESGTSNGTYAAIAGATNDTYALTPSDVGKYLKFEVTPVAIYPPTTGAPVQSSNVGPVAASSLPVASAVSIGGTQTVGSTLTGIYTYTDSGGHAEHGSTFRWLESDTQNGTHSAISGATAQTYVLTSSDIGKYVEFEVTPVSTVAVGVAVASGPSEQIQSSGVPTASSVSISGTPAVGQTLTGSYTYAQADGVTEGSSTFRWLESSSPNGSYSAIAGATNRTYTVTNSDQGRYLEFEVTPVATLPPMVGAAALSAATVQIPSTATVSPIVVSVGGGYGVPYLPGVGPIATSAASSTPPVTSSTLAASSTADIQALLNALTAQLQTLRAEAGAMGVTPPTTGTTPFVFTRDLQLHDRGTDVQMLQRFLNRQGFLVASQGPGSPGNETTLFGLHTWSALVAFQESVGIVPAKGYFGKKTRAYVNAQGK